MWIFTSNAFISAVEFDPCNGLDLDGLIPPEPRTHLMVRARDRQHLVNFGFSESKIVESMDADYPYRVFVSKSIFADMLKRHAEEIDYENFKNKAHEAMPYGMLSEVWATARAYLDPRERMQHEEMMPF